MPLNNCFYRDVKMAAFKKHYRGVEIKFRMQIKKYVGLKMLFSGQNSLKDYPNQIQILILP